jgi:chromosome segregation ATPase
MMRSGITRGSRNWKNALTAAGEDVQQCQGRICDAEDAVREGQARLAAISESLRELEGKCHNLRQQREALRQESEQVTSAVRTAECPDGKEKEFPSG